MRRIWRDNSLSIVMFGLFVLFLTGQVLAGHDVYAQELAAAGRPPVDLIAYLGTGHFIEATFENWESEFLQMGGLVLFSVFLYQHGSPESKDPDRAAAVDRKPDRARPGAPWPIRAGGIVQVIYEHSLALALFGLFGTSLLLHVLGGVAQYNLERADQGATSVTALEFVATPDFWFQSMQNWQSEFLSVGVLVVLGIFLRQRGSPESKPVDESHASTG
jgi:hypothetical protein